MVVMHCSAYVPSHPIIPLRVADNSISNQILDPSINSLPYLYALLAHVQAAQPSEEVVSDELVMMDPTDPIWAKAIQFLQSFDGRQVRYAGNEWRRVIEMVATSAMASDRVCTNISELRY